MFVFLNLIILELMGIFCYLDIFFVVKLRIGVVILVLCITVKIRGFFKI